MKGPWTIARSSTEYPELLKEIPDPPNKLWVAGSLPSQSPCVAVVGSRKATPYGLEVAYWFGSELARSGCTVVSGMARGIDSASHLGALDAGAPTVAVLGCGVDKCYPPSNGRTYRRILAAGAVVSEYELGVKAKRHHFPERNRIIAGMSVGVVVVEGTRTGGAMITARLAGEYGREVFCVPGPIHSEFSEGPHGLIRDGARCVSSPNDVLEDLGMFKADSASKELTLTGDQKRVWAGIGADPRLIDSIASRCKMPTTTVSSVLARLELAGLATRYEGGRFARSVTKTTSM